MRVRASHKTESGVVEKQPLSIGKLDKNYTHRLFRYPAKFHPPVVDALLKRYTTSGGLVLDPFCGSGTTLVEAAVNGRRSAGSDVDPLAVAIAHAKSRQYDVEVVQKTAQRLTDRLAEVERPLSAYEDFKFTDLDESEYAKEIGDLWVPQIPKLFHWFRRYVVVDLAQLHGMIAAVEHEGARELLLIVFAAIIRNSSNADPVPVSGLEVTSHMKRLDEEGRLVNPFALYRKKLASALLSIREYADALVDDALVPEVFECDATELTLKQKADAIITSPPYHSAVDYYRRHQLEMYWLGLTAGQSERLELLPKYIGRSRVPASHPSLVEPWKPTPLAAAWEAQMEKSSPSRARDFRAYMASMAKVFARLANLLPADAPALFVVGRSAWDGDDIPTDELFVEMAAHLFELDEHLTYPVINRYMSYARRNGASIDEEHVLVLRRRSDHEQ
ncbi:TRM11 family SAM-dependent methyltransferase [Humibacter ginsenosidimutans]|uniref:Methyltransferase n=1 Tax=Humibacter ginsenosidimutans TaxID=2599293 RepID=A0A5B8M8E2_9MICO|nr:DNA methyltransferase [Humibacter ginsenosidimutans]QDZ15872.1 site-specific DNA-methyltransferase [Humibacter ginsenosidimutans]